MPAESPTDITIRRCTIADARVLAALAARTFHDTFTGTCTDADMQDFLEIFYNEARIARELADAEDYTFFALHHDVPVAYLRFLESPALFPHSARGKALEAEPALCGCRL